MQAEVLYLAGSASPLLVRQLTQTLSPPRRIGVLMGLLRATQKHRLGSRRSREGLQKLGWAKGLNMRIDLRWTATDDETMSIGFIDKLPANCGPWGQMSIYRRLYAKILTELARNYECSDVTIWRALRP